ncbi:MAG TPA: isocitrate/isopropylmalate family dehydrogenase [Streptosporangiaceae bacterium]|nr:isocitrate/isopropylmalate family dehydrogenase [Streptosporangiaceae bacterium]
MTNYRIAVIGGDGVGPEVIAAGMEVLQAVARSDVLAAAGGGPGGAVLARGDDPPEPTGFSLSFEQLPWGSDYYQANGVMMPADGLTLLADFDAIYLGAVGRPDVPDHITLWGLLLPIRQQFDLYLNVRPVKLLPGVLSPLRDRGPADIDMVVVRENSEGEYAGVGGRAHAGQPIEVGIGVDVFTRTGVERLARYSFELARSRRGKLASITKSNASPHHFVMWDETVEAVHADYQDVELERILVDAAAAYMISSPQRFDVVVASNLFGDILTDIGAVIQGGMGMAASANITPDKSKPGMFEPVHGSAPDIMGTGKANPIGAIWAGAMMLDHLGEHAASTAVLGAVEHVLANAGLRTADLGGTASTTEVAQEVIRALHRTG